MKTLIDSEKRNNTICIVLLSVALVVTGFCFGVVPGQNTVEPQVQYIPYTIPEYMDRVEVVEVEKEVEVPVEVTRDRYKVRSSKSCHGHA